MFDKTMHKYIFQNTKCDMDDSLAVKRLFVVKYWKLNLLDPNRP